MTLTLNKRQANRRLPNLPDQNKRNNWGRIWRGWSLPFFLMFVEFYLEILRRLRKDRQRKCQQLWQSETWFIHHDITSTQTALWATHYLASWMGLRIHLTKMMWWNQLSKGHRTTSKSKRSRDASIVEKNTWLWKWMKEFWTMATFNC